MKRIALVCVFVFFGCNTARFVTKFEAIDPKYAPVNPRPRGGVVAYPTWGTEAATKRMRTDAYKKMHEYCDGKYKIAEEKIVSSSADHSTYPDGHGGTYTTAYGSEEMMITFECLTENQNK